MQGSVIENDRFTGPKTDIFKLINRYRYTKCQNYGRKVVPIMHARPLLQGIQSLMFFEHDVLVLAADVVAEVL